MKIKGVVPASKNGDELSFEEIQEEEGVYSVVGYETIRMVVIKHDIYICVLYVNQFTLAPADRAWMGKKFLKTAEKVELTIT